MGRLKQKGKAGAAKAYITRSQAIKKLQCSLADFRRLCILKGMYLPKGTQKSEKANRGSTAPTSFYYAKDIVYLAHEPVLRKLREHKAFAKKLSRAIGRGEWSTAKNLEDNKPVYRLDHIIKERYPTFIDALRDIDDALCMTFLFASLPSSSRLPPELAENCTRLAAEWQLYIMHSHSLRKAFLSIKGVYYQAEVLDQTLTWLVPYQFAQSVPPDVDVRVMLTFLELYQTLLGFVFFKLYTDAGLQYPPPLDMKKYEGAAGIGAFGLQPTTSTVTHTQSTTPAVPIRPVSGKLVQRTIKSIKASGTTGQDADAEMSDSADVPAEIDEEFVAHPSASDPQSTTALPTLKSLSTMPEVAATKLFASYTFWLSRETSRPIFEFIVRSFGGRIGWPASSGDGSPIQENDESITHVIIDRPVAERQNETPEQREQRQRRKYVQPQWVVDCINTGKIQLEDAYAQGKTLPPHLSPFGERQGAYDPMAVVTGEDDLSNDESIEMDGDADADDGDDGKKQDLDAMMINSDDADALREAELAAEAAGVDYGAFENRLKKSLKKKTSKPIIEDDEQDMNKMMMSNKQRKLYDKIQYSKQKRESERATLEAKRRNIAKGSRRQ